MDPAAGLVAARRQFGGFDRAVGTVAFGGFVNAVGSGVVYPFAVLYFVEAVGIPFTLVGAGLLANSVATAAGTAVGGAAADWVGRKPVMVASMALAGVALAAYALVETAADFATVAGAAGLVAGLYAPASQAMVADLTNGQERERGYGLLKVAGNVGFGLGFVIGGLLYGVSPVAVFLVDGATSGAVAVLLAVALPRVGTGGGSTPTAGAEGSGRRRGRLDRLRITLGGPRLVLLATINVGFAVAYAQMRSTVPVFASRTLGLGSEGLGTLFVLNPLVLVVFQLPALAAVSGRRRTRVLVASAGLWAASFVAVAAAGTVPGAVGVALIGAFVVLRTGGEILHAPPVTALASDLGTAAGRGSRLSAIEVAKRLGFGIGPVVGGAFFDAGLEAWLWPALVGMCAVLAVGLLVVERTVTPAENGIRRAGVAGRRPAEA